jgi:hypothetical protein
MEIIGTIIQKLDLQKGTSAKGEWKKQDFIIETNDKFPKKVCVSAWSEKVDDLNRFNINDLIKVSVNIESREYNGRWYTDVRFWKIESGNNNSSQAPQANNESSNSAPVVEDFSSNDSSDDLPF